MIAVTKKITKAPWENENSYAMPGMFRAHQLFLHPGGVVIKNDKSVQLTLILPNGEVFIGVSPYADVKKPVSKTFEYRFENDANVNFTFMYAGVSQLAAILSKYIKSAYDNVVEFSEPRLDIKLVYLVWDKNPTGDWLASVPVLMPALVAFYGFNTRDETDLANKFINPMLSGFDRPKISFFNYDEQLLWPIGLWTGHGVLTVTEIARLMSNVFDEFKSPVWDLEDRLISSLINIAVASVFDASRYDPNCYDEVF